MPSSVLALFDQLSDPLLVVAADGLVVHANPPALRAFGIEPGTLLPSWSRMLGDETVDWLADRLRARDGAAQAWLPAPGGGRRAVAWQLLDDRLAAIRLGTAEPAGASEGGAAADPVPAPVPAGTAGDDDVQILMRLFADCPYPVTLQDGSWRLVDANAAWLALCGQARADIVGTDPIDRVPPEDRTMVRETRRRLQENPRRADVPPLLERRLIDAEGRERWFRVSRRAVSAGGRALSLSIWQDCTAEHQARERADRSLRELDQWFELATVGMVLFDASGLLVRANPAFEAMVGDAPVQLGDAPPAVQRLLGWMDGRPPATSGSTGAWHGQAVVERPDGARRSLHAAVRAYPVTAGTARYLAVVEDRSAEDERDLAQSQIGALMNTAGVGLVTLRDVGTVRPVAPSPVPAATDGRGGAALQAIHRELVMPESLPHYERLQTALREGRRAEVRYQIRHPQYGLRWLLTRVEPTVLASGQRSTSVVTLDVTETHQAQTRSEQLLRELTTILEGTTAGIAYVRGDVLVRCNPRFEAMLGLPGGRAVGSSLHELFGRYPAARRVAEQTLQGLTEDGVYETEIELPPDVDDMPDAPPRWVSLSVRRAAEPTALPEAIAVLTDITRLKAQQRELEVLLRDRELMFSLSDVGIAFVRDDRIQRANAALAQLAGYQVDEMVRLPLETLFPHLDEFDRLWSDESESLAATGRWTGERQLRRRDGRLLWVQVSKRLVVEGQLQAGLIASYVNVDDRHRAEEAVAMQAERTRAVLDSVLVGIVTVGPSGIEWMNRSARRMFAGDLADFIGLPIGTVATPDMDHPFLVTRYRDELLEGQAETFECRVKARDGREFWVVGNVVGIGADPSDRQLTYALLDIERRRQAEARIVETQASLQRIIEAAPMSITLVDAPSLQVMQVNQAAAQAAERPVEAMIGHRPDAWLPPQEAAARLRDMREALAAGVPTQREVRETRGGTERVWETRYVPVGTDQAPASQLLVVSTDVTEQRLAQQARFEAALAQREMLVKEVHHRIKNNLQGVAGLLEQIAARKPEVADTIAEVVAQVQAIAHVYGLQVGVNGALRVASVVQAITQSVERTFGRPISVMVTGESPLAWVLPEAESIPIALTLNELLTNAIKHSADRQAVECTLTTFDDAVQVAIANRGRVPPSFRLERFPLGVSGLGLVRALLPRRGAHLVIEPRGEQVVAHLTVRPPVVRRDNGAPTARGPDPLAAPRAVLPADPSPVPLP